MSFKIIISVCFILIFLLILFFFLFYRKDDRKEFLHFFWKVGLYALPIILVVLVYFFTAKKHRSVLNGISMSEQLNQGFHNAVAYKAKTYILGNSRCYRGLNPDVLGFNVYNFAYDNETFLEQYYKLIYLKKHGSLPNTIILGVDYFEFSFVSVALKDVYKNYFSPDYLTSINRFTIKSNNQLSKLNNLINSQVATLFGRSASQYLNFLYYHYILNEPIQYPYLKDNGQYIISPLPSAKEGDFVKRDSNILDVQKYSFESIVSFVKSHNIKLFLVMPPTRQIERDSYRLEFTKRMDEYFKSQCTKGGGYYINYFNDNEFVTADFMDDTHLTPVGADRFSEKLRMDIDVLNQNKK